MSSGERSAPHLAAWPRPCHAARDALQPRMIERSRPLAPELWPTDPAPAPALLLELLATLWQDHATQPTQNAVPRQRAGELETWEAEYAMGRRCGRRG